MGDDTFESYGPLPGVSPRAVSYLAAAVFCHAACIWTPPPQPHRYVIAGQSNATGASTQTTPNSAMFGSSYGHDNVWRPAVDPTIHFPGASKSSPWPAMIIDRSNATGRRVDLVASAQGGRCLVYPHPVTGDPPAWRPQDGSAYADMLAYVTTSGWSAPDAVLWHQGECDADAWNKDPAVNAQDAYQDYRSGLEGLADWIWADLGVPLVVAPISLVWCRFNNPTCDPALYQRSRLKRVPIHDATIDAALQHSHIVLGPLSDDLLHEPDNSHIHDVIEMGRRWAEVLEAEGL